MDVSAEKPVLLFKQSTTCPISATFAQFQQYLNESKEDIAAYFVKVRESRPVSNQIAEELGIRHESLQILLVKNKEAVWNTSHAEITQASIQAALISA